MTSIPERNGMLAPTLRSLARQETRPDEIRLYLTPGCKVPDLFATLPMLVYWTDDHGPITKLSAALDTSLADDTIIVTVDDDIEYGPRWLKRLSDRAGILSQYVLNEAIGFAGWDVEPLLYQNVFRSPGVGDLADVLEGWAGVAYRRDWFKADLFDVPSWARNVDDVWISAYLNRRGILRRVIDFSGIYCRKIDGAPPGLSNHPEFGERNRFAAAHAFDISRKNL